MEAAAAFGIAGNVFQFVQFASSLLHGAVSVYQSASGSAVEIRNLEQIYGELLQFSCSITIGGAYNGVQTTGHEKEIIKLAASCEEKCHELLGLVGKLKVTPSEKRKAWKSFRAALLTVCRSAEIQRLEHEIDVHQKLLTTVLCALMDDKTTKLGLQMTQSQNGIIAAHQMLHSELLRLKQTLGKTESSIQSSTAETTNLTVRVGELERLVNQLVAAALSQAAAKEKAVLKSLDYDYRPTRRNTVGKAHKSTFEWIYQKPQDSTMKHHRFLDWLENGDGFFWIRGRPGAGKSTLMKFIVNDGRTARALQAWAAPHKYLIGSHYFWSSGSELQRSYEGLLRSILFDIFSQTPSVISSVCQGEGWWSNSSAETLSPDWSLDSLIRCLQRLAGEKTVKFCLFIDGLDEFRGDINHATFDVCEALLELSSSTNIKICVSSRPWNVFKDYFGGDLSRILDVHELTADDIETYAHDQLVRFPWGRCSTVGLKDVTHSPDHATRLLKSFVETIRSRSEGVFLWVFLVVGRLKDGITNGDSILQLQRRLDKLPANLETFFRKMLEDVDSEYHQRMAAFLRIALASTQKPIPVAIYASHDDEYDKPSPMLGPLECNTHDLGDTNLFHKMKKRIQAITQGLLEVDDMRSVQFLHRTVADFLATGPMMQYLVEKSHPNFSPNVAILRASVANWNVPPHSGLLRHNRSDGRAVELTPELMEKLMSFVWSYVRPAAIENYPETVHLIAEWEHATRKVVSLLTTVFLQAIRLYLQQPKPNSWSLHWIERTFQQCNGDHLKFSSVLFRVFLLRTGLETYVKSKLEEDKDYFRGLPWSPLSPNLAVPMPNAWHDEDYELHNGYRIGVVQLLLDYGYDPNELNATEHIICRAKPSRDPITAWQEVMDGGLVYPISALGRRLLSLLLQFGADPNATVESCESLPSWTIILLAAFGTSARHRGFDNNEFLRLFKSVLSAGSDISLLVRERDHNLLSKFTLSAWEDLKSDLREYGIEIKQEDCVIMTQSLEFTSRVLCELARAEKANGSKVLPWDDIKPLLQTIYPDQLLQPLLGMVETEE